MALAKPRPMTAGRHDEGTTTARTIDDATDGLRALVLHADAASLRSLAWALEARFFSVCTAPDGTLGLELLLEQLLSLDVLVIDAALPDRDALAFAELIR